MLPVSGRQSSGRRPDERARALSRGAEPPVEPGRDHWTVVALREIAAARLDLDRLGGDLLRQRPRVRADDDGPTDAFEHWEALAASDAGEEQVDSPHLTRWDGGAGSWSANYPQKKGGQP